MAWSFTLDGLMALNFPSFHPQNSPQFLSSQTKLRPFSFRFSLPKNQKPRALREWREYEDAVKEKDLARALRFLKSVETNPIEPFNDSSSSDLGLVQSERDWEVLDACLNADDMKLVGSAYSFLKNRGFLPNFGKCRNIGEFLNVLDFFWKIPPFCFVLAEIWCELFRICVMLVPSGSSSFLLQLKWAWHIFVLSYLDEAMILATKLRPPDKFQILSCGRVDSQALIPTNVKCYIPRKGWRSQGSGEIIRMRHGAKWIEEPLLLGRREIPFTLTIEEGGFVFQIEGKLSASHGERNSPFSFKRKGPTSAIWGRGPRHLEGILHIECFMDEYCFIQRWDGRIS